MKEIRIENPLIEEREPVAFTIVGTRAGEPAEERFECLTEPPFATIQMLIGRQVDMGAYIRLCLKAHEEKRWDQLVTDKDFQVHPQTVRDVYHALVGHYADRPTQAPGGSGPGRETTADSSTVDGASKDSTSEPSAETTSEQPQTSLEPSSTP